MSLENISEVIIDSEGDFKFIQIEYNGRDIIYGNSKELLHSELYRSFLREFKKEDQSRMVIIRGGGRIRISKEYKAIEAYGYSDSYGRFNLEIVKDILTKFIEEKMKGFSLKIC